MLYFTYNDAPSGIYSGQVIDVCRYLSELQGGQVRLLALVSLRGYWKSRDQIKSQYGNAIVLPMFPKPKNWRKNTFTLRLVRFFTGDRSIMARGPFATALALRLKKKGVFEKVIFDARGAYAAELNEYNVVEDEQVKAEIMALEKEVIAGSDRQLVVSRALADHWRAAFGYTGNTEVIVPCTLNTGTDFPEISESLRHAARVEAGFGKEDIILVYSGSASGWQSLNDFGTAVLPLMERDARVKLLLLLPSLPENFAPQNRFPDRVKRNWVKAEEVGRLLALGDYGWLVREQSVTNRVASPVKFAEYLAAGLQVLISENLGDYSQLVRSEGLGLVVDATSLPPLEPVGDMQRQRNSRIAQERFVKSFYRKAYESLLA